MRAVPVRFWNKVRNNGDGITFDIVKTVFGMEPYYVEEGEKHLLGVGSILFMANNNSIVWGSGQLNRDTHLPYIPPRNIRCLRGHLTRNHLLRKGIRVEDIPFGDPGMLVSRFGLPAAPDPSGRIAVIPHHSSCRHPFFAEAGKRDDVRIINMMDTSLTPIREIAAADVVISQSLHGLIYAEALNKPSVWISHRDDDIWCFKFRDWFTTTLNPQANPEIFELSVDELVRRAEVRFFSESIDDLVSSFPRELIDYRPSDRIGYHRCRNNDVVKIFSDSDFQDLGEDDIRRLLQRYAANFRGRWAERPYLFIFSSSHRILPDDAVLRRITEEMDHRSEVDVAYVTRSTAVRRGSHCDLDADLCETDASLGERDLILVRPSFNGDLGQGITFGV